MFWKGSRAKNNSKINYNRTELFGMSIDVPQGFTLNEKAHFVAFKVPENPTNGDMIKAIFPGTTGMGFDAQLNFEMHLNNEHNYHVGKFNQDWWNEPYVYKENKK